ncbi:hypothetical protein MKK75_31045 [Methylobacterium sp. J-030]|uniref:hypothetical protein n=1 Tax=Methylobacterium sp. J-030 TaxID=2836627 RepID=UPI001FBAD682|nr:hypothetical protein [Methylobacterium sp. J-030]MCJ2073171.1 hypothetical protein [Methylobacterium sp. J-030]
MRIVFAGLIVLGSVVDAMAAETYSNYCDYFDSEPASAHRADRKSLRKTAPATHGVDTRRHHDYGEDLLSKNPDNLRPGYRGAAGTYVPLDYSTHPSGLAGDGFGGSASQSYGSYGAPNPFGGSLGTRR